jgi:SAM-dependent methyltransferase
MMSPIEDSTAADKHAGGGATSGLGDAAGEAYWSGHNVTAHHAFQSIEDSIQYFHWRNDQYFGYIDLLPVKNADGLCVLDFGCGPGHDLAGFGVYSKPRRLIGMDLSVPSLDEARQRLALHGVEADLVKLDATQPELPLEARSVDLVHSSGVLHHTPDIAAVLREFRRILKPGGRAQIMIYNEHSIWLNLYVAYQKMLVEGLHQGLSVREAFGKLTDGPNCPISFATKPSAFVSLAQEIGFEARFAGAAVSAFEMSLLPRRYEAIMDRRLPAEHRRFLCELTFSDRGFPLYENAVAGIDACYHLSMPRA